MPCHSGSNPSSGLNLTSYENIMSGSNSGAVINIGDYENSILWQEVSSGDMPNNIANNNLGISDLTTLEIVLLENWILDLQCMVMDCEDDCALGECITYGCIDEIACNYTENSTIDDNSCIYPGMSCITPLITNGIIDSNCECIEINSSIQELNTTKQLIKVIDLLGRNTPFNSQDVILLHIYEDGTIDKIRYVK